MAKCNYCSKVVSPSATLCPNCGEPDPTEGQSSGCLMYVVGGFILIALIIGSGNKSSETSSTDSANGNHSQTNPVTSVSNDQSVSVQKSELSNDSTAKTLTYAPISQRQRVIGSQELNVRNGPNVNYEIIGKVYLGDILYTYEQVDGWTRIGLDQWVKSNYLEQL